MYFSMDVLTYSCIRAEEILTLNRETQHVAEVENFELFNYIV